MANQTSYQVSADTSTALKQFENLRKEMKQNQRQAETLTAAYRDLVSKGLGDTQEAQEYQRAIDVAIKKAGELKDIREDMSASIKYYASDTKIWDTTSSAIQTVVSGIQVATGAMTMFGVSEEKASQVTAQLTSLLSISNGLLTIQKNIQKDSALVQGLLTAKTRALTIAQKIYNSVLMSNPYVAVAAGVVALGTAVYGLTQYLKDNNEVNEEQQKQVEKLNRVWKEEKEIREQVSQTLSKQIPKYNALKKVWDDCNGSISKQKQFLKDYKTELKNININNLLEAERAFANDNSFIEGLKKRAKELAKLAQVQKLYAQMEDLGDSPILKKKWSKGDDITIKEAHERGLGQDAYKTGFWGGFTLTDKGAEIMNQYETTKSTNQRKKEMQELQDRIDKKVNSISTENIISKDTGSTSTSSGGSKNTTKVDVSKIKFAPIIDKSDLKEQLTESEKIIREFYGDDAYAWSSALSKSNIFKTDHDDVTKSLKGKDSTDVTDFEQRGWKAGNEQMQEYIEHLKEVKDFTRDVNGMTFDNVVKSIQMVGDAIGGTTGQMISWVATSASSVAQMLAQNAQLLVSANALSLANGAKSAFALPFPYNLAAWATTLATITSIFSSLPKFAEGGIVSSSSSIGDRGLARVNGNEMILNTRQQGNLFKLLNGGFNTGSGVNNGTVSFEISGQKLYGVLKNTSKLNNTKITF